MAKARRRPSHHIGFLVSAVLCTVAKPGDGIAVDEEATCPTCLAMFDAQKQRSLGYSREYVDPVYPPPFALTQGEP